MNFAALSLVEQPSDREVVFTRLLDAPREMVWKAWTDPQYLEHWWGPVGFTTTTLEFALVVGGVWRSVMHGPDGTDYPTRIVFREVAPPSRLAYDNGWDLPGAPIDFHAVATFEAVGAQTRLALHFTFDNVDAYRTAVERYGVLEGGKQTFDRLAEYLQGHD